MNSIFIKEEHPIMDKSMNFIDNKDLFFDLHLKKNATEFLVCKKIILFIVLYV